MTEKREGLESGTRRLFSIAAVIPHPGLIPDEIVEEPINPGLGIYGCASCPNIRILVKGQKEKFAEVKRIHHFLSFSFLSLIIKRIPEFPETKFSIIKGS